MPGRVLNYEGLHDFISAIEVLLHMKGPGSTSSYNFKHFLIAGCVSGLIMSSSLPRSISELASNMGFPTLSQSLEESSCDILEFVRNADDQLWQLIIAEGDGMLPSIFVPPEEAMKMFNTLFRESFGVFPSLCSWSEAHGCLKKSSEDIRNNASEMACNVLLSIAKLVHESKLATLQLPEFENSMHVGPSLILLLYYLAFAAYPSPSACNNLGIILSTTPWMDTPGSRTLDLAKAYYEKGLELDGSHAHLLTNMGSLLVCYIPCSISIQEENSYTFGVCMIERNGESRRCH